MALTVVTIGLYYAPVAALIQLESLNMLLKVDASAYTSGIPSLNEYLI